MQDLKGSANRFASLPRFCPPNTSPIHLDIRLSKRNIYSLQAKKVQLPPVRVTQWPQSADSQTNVNIYVCRRNSNGASSHTRSLVIGRRDWQSCLCLEFRYSWKKDRKSLQPRVLGAVWSSGLSLRIRKIRYEQRQDWALVRSRGELKSRLGAQGTAES